MKGWQITIAVGLGLVALIAGGRWWQEQQRVTAAKTEGQKILAKDAAYMESVLGAERNEAGLNYKEFFDLCDKAIEGRRALLVELRGAGVGLDVTLLDNARAFIETGNSLIRAKRQVYRKQLDLNAAEQSKLPKIRAMIIPNIIDREETIKTMASLVADNLTLADELKKAADDFVDQYRRYQALELAVLGAWAQPGLRMQGAAEQYQALNTKAVAALHGKISALKVEMNNASVVLAEAAARPPSMLSSSPVPPRPIFTASMVNYGQVLYEGRAYAERAACLVCHGATGKGDGNAGSILNPRPSDLTNLGTLRYRADEERFNVIRYGIRGTGMVGAGNLSDNAVWALVSYLKFLAEH